ncbi:tetratricopeptide repeat protein [Pseudobacteriovorax antillogorgiicola]|uniref:Tetratricopeptide repeat-containing protein n=1 Tax=Pseudobacteriovorax antillogorgiicola TaxID=1513793 RepID=A0A1Y6BP37_9BACT|nr:tetratricopeptide repeat protein [Pseudobacteriovorax antillogorgiicola]TCS53805.1 tetratricopeptide repeat protein [Pseudobacteriovorax antillogorgiicola]SMF22079.1 Tetratricopeptide repeat-containing protein [Pseudobacteriovorax antillogorgiicola]
MAEVRDLAKKFGLSIPTQVDQEDIVCLVEDQTDMRLIVAHHLNKIGFKNIKQFTNGHEALDWLKNSNTAKISVTICDHEMPIMNGFDFLAELKADPDLVRGPFAITIDNPSRAKIMLATENGVDGVLVKPFTLKDILPKLRQAFKVFHNPGNPELLYENAKGELRQGNLEKAEHVYKSLMDVTSKAARPLVGLAQVAVRKDDFTRAEALLKSAEERNDHYVHLYVERGELFSKQNRVEEAIGEFKRAIQLSPLNPIRYERAAQLLFKLDKHQEAIDILNIAIQNELSFPALHHYLSQGYYVLKEYKKAIRHIRSALSVEPENVVYLNQLGISYKESEEPEAALKTYNQIIKLDPENKAALYNKAILMKVKGNLDEAIKVLDRCLTKHPNFKQAKDKYDEYRAEKEEQKKEQAS